MMMFSECFIGSAGAAAVAEVCRHGAARRRVARVDWWRLSGLLLFGYLIGQKIIAAAAQGVGAESCFCKGEIDDCSCNVESVDSFNNNNVHPILSRILERDYFRYYKVNMFRPCPFAQASSGQCGSRSCAVDECREDQIPAGLKKNHSHEKAKYTKEAQDAVHDAEDRVKQAPRGPHSLASPAESCKKATGSGDGTVHEHSSLGDLDVHISEQSKEAFQSWKKYDDQLNNFCEIDDIESPDAVYYDLVRNPERFTGYTGPSAVNVWKLIYDQNCFKPDTPAYGKFTPPGTGLCLEKRTFFRLISGFHTSINVDVTANWLIPGKTAFEAPSWGPNVEEFVKRFDPKFTFGDGPNRLKNLYFAYLVEMRALVKVAPYLLQESLYTGNEKEDNEVKQMVADLLDILKSFPTQFDESKLFQGDAQKLMDDFKLHFNNISHIMDCVGCDKCRLWGKVQPDFTSEIRLRRLATPPGECATTIPIPKTVTITGMGTALKILFSGDSMSPDSTVRQEHRRSKTLPFQLVRGEIVALFNAFGRLSKSIHEIQTFRELLS